MKYAIRREFDVNFFIGTRETFMPVSEINRLFKEKMNKELKKCRSKLREQRASTYAKLMVD